MGIAKSRPSRCFRSFKPHVHLSDYLSDRPVLISHYMNFHFWGNTTDLFVFRAKLESSHSVVDLTMETKAHFVSGSCSQRVTDTSLRRLQHVYHLSFICQCFGHPPFLLVCLYRLSCTWQSLRLHLMGPSPITLNRHAGKEHQWCFIDLSHAAYDLFSSFSLCKSNNLWNAYVLCTT